MTRSKGRTGRPWRRAREQVKATNRVCWICGHHIDLNLKFPHPQSFTVDHIIPLARGGPGNDPANLRASHLHCNSSRGAGRRTTTVRTSRRW